MSNQFLHRIAQSVVVDAKPEGARTLVDIDKDHVEVPRQESFDIAAFIDSQRADVGPAAALRKCVTNGVDTSSLADDGCHSADVAKIPTDMVDLGVAAQTARKSIADAPDDIKAAVGLDGQALIDKIKEIVDARIAAQTPAPAPAQTQQEVDKQ